MHLLYSLQKNVTQAREVGIFDVLIACVDGTSARKMLATFGSISDTWYIWDVRFRL